MDNYGDIECTVPRLMNTALLVAMVVYLSVGTCCTVVNLFYRNTHINIAYTVSLIVLWLPISFVIMRQQNKQKQEKAVE
jgi:hypothetical protein